ncbi:MAG: purine-binding chemotaxis protein CheW [Planctomycetes bacterium]|nr:purine-binding chemotaxis protein CheW [Planctomycetota bacterium]
MNSNKKEPQKKDTKQINWDEIHRGLETSQDALDRGLQPTHEEKNKILKSRAKILAVEPEKKAKTEEFIQVVEFLLACEKYAVGSEYVREIYPLKEFTPIPCTPLFVLGIVNIRGQILSVIDIKKFFDIPEKGLTDLNKVIILHSKSMEFGILADAVTGVRNIAASELQTSLPTLTGVREEYLKGVTKERTVILDAEKLLSDKSIIVHDLVEI